MSHWQDGEREVKGPLGPKAGVVHWAREAGRFREEGRGWGWWQMGGGRSIATGLELVYIILLLFTYCINNHYFVVLQLGYTPLHHAAQQGHVMVIKYLLKCGASPNIITAVSKNVMCYHQASIKHSVKYLLKSDASPNKSSWTWYKYDNYLMVLFKWFYSFNV